MNTAVTDSKLIVDTIAAAIASRGFYIVPAAEEIPGCRGDKSAKLERVQQFACDNGWHVTVHNGNGWLLFTDGKYPVAEDFENDLGQLAELIEASPPENRAPSKAVPRRNDSLRIRE